MQSGACLLEDPQPSILSISYKAGPLKKILKRPAPEDPENKGVDADPRAVFFEATWSPLHPILIEV